MLAVRSRLDYCAGFAARRPSAVALLHFAAWRPRGAAAVRGRLAEPRWAQTSRPGALAAVRGSIPAFGTCKGRSPRSGLATRKGARPHGFESSGPSSATFGAAVARTGVRRRRAEPWRARRSRVAAAEPAAQPHRRPPAAAGIVSDVRVGILTGGGDCPGLNAVIRAVARRSFDRGDDVVGVREGWRGLVERKAEELGPQDVAGLLPRGGTIIGTSRTNPYKLDGGVEKVLENTDAARARRAGGGRRRGHPRRRGQPPCRARLCSRRRAEDDRQRPLGDGLHVRIRHGGQRLRPRRSTGCTRPPSRTTASWSSR